MRVGGVWRKEGVRTAGCGNGCPLPTWDGSERVLCLLPPQKNDFASHIPQANFSANCVLFVGLQFKLIT